MLGFDRGLRPAGRRGISGSALVAPCDKGVGKQLALGPSLGWR